MSKSTFTQGWMLIVAVVLLAVAVFEPVGGQPASAQTTADPGTIAYVRMSTQTSIPSRLTARRPGAVDQSRPERDEKRDVSRMAARRSRTGFLQRTRGGLLVVRQRRLRHRLQWRRLPTHHQLAGLRRARRPAQGLGDGRGRQLHEYPGVGLCAGRAGHQWVDYSGTVRFDDVADFGPGVYQPSIGIYGLTRFTSYPPYADVQPGQTVPGGNLTIMSLSGFRGFGAGKVSWKADGSALAYGMRSASGISQIPVNAALRLHRRGSPGGREGIASLVAWGPTPATKDQYLYLSGNARNRGKRRRDLPEHRGQRVRRHATVIIPDYSGQYVHGHRMLPDGSGFLFALGFVQFPPDPPACTRHF